MKGAHKRDKIARRRVARKTAHEQQRKLKRKLYRIVDLISAGYYEGVKNSPLLKANIGLAQRVLKKRGIWG